MKSKWYIRYDINDTVDELVKLETLPRLGQLKTFKLRTLSFSYVSTKECMQVETQELESWKTTIVEYLLKGILLEEREKAKKWRTQAAKYKIANEMYQRGFFSPLLKCLDNEQVDYVVRELYYKGICGMHSRGRSMAARVLRVGYY
ncbi:hypothetical protein D0Y65_048565 [Glycine soja]|nr:hypothetical protein D0Y65_048565 [Glycine soja]